jgi:aflatoxin B1 aldehyde reductase
VGASAAGRGASHPVKLILGTMTFGQQVDREIAREMVTRFLSAGHLELDTAYVYNSGDSERTVGSILQTVRRDDVVVATKVNPRVTGKLDANAVADQLEDSLTRLGRDAVDILYLHFPDPSTPVEVTLEACTSLHTKGRFTELGLSNFPAWEVVDIWHLCRERGWPQPTVYQGLYNGLSRNVEDELMPALRRLGMRFYAYNPLAGGLLSERYARYDEGPSSGRFTLRPNYRDRYWKASLFEARGLLTDRCAEAGIPVAQAAYRWLAFHSHLDGRADDGVIVGASTSSQLDQNLSAITQGALPPTVSDAFDEAWLAARPDSPAYFRHAQN